MTTPHEAEGASHEGAARNRATFDAAAIEAAVADLDEGTRTWAALTLRQRATLLRRIRTSVAAVAPEWAAIAARSKGLGDDHPLRGEEWLAGPYGVLVALDAYAQTLDDLARGRSPLERVRTRRTVGDRVAVLTSPLNAVDAALLSGYSTEVWLTPGVSPRLAHVRAGLAQQRPSEPGGIGLVLGAGNVTSIPVLDVLYELLAANRVMLLKLNPTQDALAPVFECALAPLIGLGLLRIVRGGGDVGAQLVRHPAFAHVHITGSGATFAAIAPDLTVPITAELGGVSPIIVVPGRWSAADLRFQAEHVATMRLQNAGHNCIAGQVVLLSRDWPQRDAFVAELERAVRTAPSRGVWYPGSAERLAAASTSYPDAVACGPDRLLVTVGSAPDARTAGTSATAAIADAGATAATADAGDRDTAGAGAQPGRGDRRTTEALETTEYFAPVLGVVDLAGDAAEFLAAAVAHANDRLVGTLGANVLIDPATQHALGRGFDEVIAELRYGTVAVNAWTALGFLTPTATWGAYPGGTVADAPSGIGIVHNALLLDDVERTVVRGPFRPFARSLRLPGRPGRLSLLPKPPWFVSSRTGAAVSEGLTRFRVDRSIRGIIRTLLLAYRA